MNLVMLGYPGSGKGTQGKMIAQKFGIPHISTGDIFRDILKTDSSLAKKIKSIVNSGALVPDEIVVEIVKERLSKDDCKSGFLIDGFPRNKNQAELFDAYLSGNGRGISAVIYLKLSPQESIKRLTARYYCPKCGRNYNIISQPPKDDTKCDVCGVGLAQRKDDSPEVIKERLKIYESETLPIAEYYSRKKKLKEINADLPVEKVFNGVIKELSNINDSSK